MTAALGLADTLGPTFWASALFPAEGLGRFAVRDARRSRGRRAVRRASRRDAGIRGIDAALRTCRDRPTALYRLRAGRLATQETVASRTRCLPPVRAGAPAHLGQRSKRRSSCGTPPAEVSFRRDPARMSRNGCCARVRRDRRLRDDPVLPSRGLAWSVGVCAVPRSRFGRWLWPGTSRARAARTVTGAPRSARCCGPRAPATTPCRSDRPSEPELGAPTPPPPSARGRPRRHRGAPRPHSGFRARLGRSPPSPFAVGATAAAWRLGPRRAVRRATGTARAGACALELAAPRFGHW